MATGILGRLTGRIFGEAFGYGIGGAISPALAPFTEQEVQKFWDEFPVQLILPADLAAMVVQGVMEETEAAKEARKSGIDENRFHKLFLVNGNPIAPEQALDLWNRGEIKETDVARALLQSRLKPEWAETFKLLKRRILQESELAEMVVQSVLDEDTATKRAAHVGVEADDFHHLVRLAGNPPGPQDTLTLWNRGILSEPEATLALRQSRLKPEWIEQFKQSRHRLATTAEIVEATVRERISYDEGVKLAAKIGTDAETFHLLYETGGRPISITQALTLYNRGLYTQADVRAVVARSNVRPEFTEAILHLRVRYPSLFQVRQLISTATVTDEQGTKLLTDQGYPDWLATAIVTAAHHAKTHADRDLTKSEILTLHTDGAISRDDASGMLEALGYDQREADFLLTLADFRREAKYLNAVIAKVHSQFVNHRIDVNLVTTTLDKIGVATQQREDLLTLWEEEKAANVRTLTPAQIVRANHKGIMPDVEALTELQQLGYSQRDATILLAL